jgi:beta-phosphoglucomutase-like phosphatase (HAD superfamily)
MMEVIILGVDGVLAETHEMRRNAFNRAFADGCIEWRWGRVLYAELLKMRGGADMLDDFIDSQFPYWERTDDLKKLVMAINRRQKSITRQMLDSGSVTLRPGVLDFMHFAARSGVRLAIATEESEAEVAALLHANLGGEAGRLFDVVAAGDAAGNAQSAHDRVLDALATNASACLAVESSLAGVRSAAKARIPIAIASGTYQQLLDCCDLLATDVGTASSTVVSRWDAVAPHQLLAELRLAHVARTAANDTRVKQTPPRHPEKEIAHASG